MSGETLLTTRGAADTAGVGVARPYPPSWFDRLVAAVDRSRVSSWAFYLALALPSIAIFLVADVLSGAFPLTSVLPFHAFVAALPALTLWFMDYLDDTAGRALQQATPVMSADPEKLALLHYELTTMPARPVLLVTALGGLSIAPIMAAVLVLDQADTLLTVLGVTRTSLSLAAFVLFMTIAWAIGFVFFYHAGRQLRQVSRIYAHHVEVDLVSLGPLYALSRISALTAAGIQVQSVLWIVTNPAAGGSFLPLIFLISEAFVSAVIFLVPLWGIHRRIADEKARRLSENARGREALMSELRRGVESQDLARATPIKDAVLAYDVEAKAYASTRTWPWEPETLRLLLTAVLLPTGLFVLQYVLREFLGP